MTEPPLLPPAEAAQASAVAKGRRFSSGIRLHMIVRETSEEARAEGDRLISRIDDRTIAAAQASFARFDSEGQRRIAALRDGRRDKLLVGPNLWAGIGLVRGAARTALVGNPQEVASRMREYMATGIAKATVGRGSGREDQLFHVSARSAAKRSGALREPADRGGDCRDA